MIKLKKKFNIFIYVSYFRKFFTGHKPCGTGVPLTDVTVKGSTTRDNPGSLKYINQNFVIILTYRVDIIFSN